MTCSIITSHHILYDYFSFLQFYLKLFISLLEGPCGVKAHVCRVPAASFSSSPTPWPPRGHGAGRAWVPGAVDCGELWPAIGQNVLWNGGQKNSWRRNNKKKHGTLNERKASNSSCCRTWVLPRLVGDASLVFNPFPPMSALLSLLSIFAVRWAVSGVRALPGPITPRSSSLVSNLTHFGGNHSPAFQYSLGGVCGRLEHCWRWDRRRWKIWEIKTRGRTVLTTEIQKWGLGKPNWFLRPASCVCIYTTCTQSFRHSRGVLYTEQMKLERSNLDGAQEEEEVSMTVSSWLSNPLKRPSQLITAARPWANIAARLLTHHTDS